MSAATDVHTRIHDEAVVIDPVRVRQFFSARSRHVDGQNPLATALLHDERPALAQARDQYERQFAMALLDLDGSQEVLDVGCGIGRWTESLLARSAGYTGIDYTPSLLDAARAAHPRGRFALVDAANGLDLAVLDRTRGFDRVVVSGLLNYLNDGEVAGALLRITQVCAPGARVYLRTAVSTGSRLTLRGDWSEEMAEEYHAIYRTPAELEALLRAGFGAAGFTLAEAGDLFPPALNAWEETRQGYHLWRRG